MGRMRPSQTVPVVLSLALYGNRDAQLCTLANVLGQTVAPLVVHNSFIGGHHGGRSQGATAGVGAWTHQPAAESGEPAGARDPSRPLVQL